MTSSASGAGGVGTDVPNYLGRKGKKKVRKEKKKKKPSRRSHIMSHVFRCEIRFAASGCEMFSGDCGYRSAEKWRGAGGGPSAADGGRSERRAAVGRIFYDK